MATQTGEFPPAAQPRPSQAYPPPGINVTSHFDDMLTSQELMLYSRHTA
ncbi:hypothetical protein NUKP16_09260 [Klebsiella quasipneumoniae]|nr:hypothetical protein NUKP16_09260 [Klebsiella quasipneumoniae]GKQ03782.1 hypothetical protein NUKP771_23610 [Klebsiella quasipneumoniae]